jgi:hypothetical protein
MNFSNIATCISLNMYVFINVNILIEVSIVPEPKFVMMY